MPVAGLIGYPVGHSLSPVMHNAAFKALGMDGRYELWETTLEDLPARVAALRGDGVLGGNVTVPHKQAVMPMLDEVTETARRIGAVNTVIPSEGRLTGDNTDAYGFSRSLRDVVDLETITQAVVVGAGGAARAVLVSLQEAGITNVIVINRTLDRAKKLVAGLTADGQAPIVAGSWDALDDVARSAGLIVNATPVGWHGEEMPFDRSIVDELPDHAVVMDLTYRHTALLRAAEGRKLEAIDGLPMLIHQGARSFELWTGVAPPVDVMTSAVLAEQARRS
jgi:shikimate dehydrogenase